MSNAGVCSKLGEYEGVVSLTWGAGAQEELPIGGDILVVRNKGSRREQMNAPGWEGCSWLRQQPRQRLGGETQPGVRRWSHLTS